MLYLEFKKQLEVQNKLNIVRNIYRQQQRSILVNKLSDMIQSTLIDEDITLPDQCFKYIVEYDMIDIHISSYTLTLMLDEVLNIDLGFIGDVTVVGVDSNGNEIDSEIIDIHDDSYIIRIENVWSYLK